MYLIERNYEHNYYFNIDLITLEDSIKVLSHGKTRLPTKESVIKMNCFYAPSVQCAIKSES